MDKIKLELVKIARDLCFTEYTDRRAQLHNKWLVESEHLWRTQRLRLAYPDMPEYPGEAHIMAKAEKLYEYINNKPTVLTSDVAVPESDSNVVTETEPDPQPEIMPVTESVAETPETSSEAVSEPPREPLDNVIELKQPEPEPEATSGDSGDGQPQPSESQQETPPPVAERPKTSMEKRQEAEAKLLELIKEQSKLQTGIGVARTETTTNRLIPGIINKLSDIKNSLSPPGPPRGGS